MLFTSFILGFLIEIKANSIKDIDQTDLHSQRFGIHERQFGWTGYSNLFYYVKHSKIGAREVTWPSARNHIGFVSSCRRQRVKERSFGPRYLCIAIGPLARLLLLGQQAGLEPFVICFELRRSEVKSPGPEGPDF